VKLKKLTIGVAVAALIGGTFVAQPAKAASGELVIGSVLDIDRTDPHTSTNFATVRGLGLVYGSLIEIGAKNAIKGGLASSWVFNSDSTQLTLNLRKGVKFHDGSTFDAEDAKASLERILDTKTGAAARANIATITSITAKGRQLILKMSVPNAPILAALEGVNMAMLSKDDIDAGKIGGSNKPNGTGPYKWGTWEPTQSLKLTSFADYYAGEPSIGAVTIRVIPNEASILSALNAGTIGMGIVTDPLIARQVKSNLKTFKVPALAYYALQFNTKQAPLDDKNVRLAIQCAIDRDELIKTALLGEGKVTGPITSPDFRSNPTARPCPTVNLAKAREYLAAAGKSSGVTFKTLVTSTGWATSVAMAQNLKAQLAKVNITMDLDIVEQGTYVPRWLAADFTATLANNGGRVDPDTMYTRYFTSTGNLNKVATYSSSTLDANFLKGKASGKAPVRKDAYTAISKELEDNAVWVWLATPYEYRVATKKLRGFTALANGSLLQLRFAKLG
jgi:peptide/nickel transport system substrate-binding protein